MTRNPHPHAPQQPAAKNPAVNDPAKADPTKAELARAAESFLAAGAAFAEVLDAETAAVKALDFERLDSLVADKTRLARDYASQAQYLRDNGPALGRVAGSAAKGRMMQTQKRIAAAISENLQALDATCRASRQVVELIVDSARRAQTQISGYGPAGGGGAGGGSGQGDPAALRSVSLNTSL